MCVLYAFFVLAGIKYQKTQNWCRTFRPQKYRYNIYQFRLFSHHFFSAKKLEWASVCILYNCDYVTYMITLCRL